MKAHLVRENSIWNMMLFGKARDVVVTPNSPQSAFKDDKKENYQEEPLKFAKEYYSEKVQPYQFEPRNSSRFSLKNKIFLVIIGALLYFHLNPSVSFFHTSNFSSLNYIQDIVDDGELVFGAFNASTPSVPPTEVFAVSFPLLENPVYGTPVHSSILVNHTFGNSWGHPAIANYSPPAGVKFNKVVLTLNTSVTGVQYDRLANLFVGGAQIWRTSTAEPGGKEVFSSFSKDVSKYLSLFTKDSKVVFQLDNLLTPRLTGSFDVQLIAHFYDSPIIVSESGNVKSVSPYGNGTKYDLLSHTQPASSVFPLISSGSNSGKPPLAYLPSDKIHVNLPTFSQNTTRLTLSVFVSGNSAEEFWYTDVLEQYTHRFDQYGKTLLGHGPVRIVNIFFNGEKIATQSPQPFIFTGGISPALWSPTVAIDAFDLPSIEVDLTALLPLLWENQSVEDRFIEIEVSNGYDELSSTTTPQGGIAENWITSANVLSYENSKVVGATGEIKNITDDIDITTFAISPPFSGFLQQIIHGKAFAEITSSLNFTLVDGSILDTTISSFTEASITNIQSYKSFGEKQSLVHVGGSEKSITFVDNSIDEDSLSTVMKKKHKDHKLANNTISQVNTSYAYPLVAQLTEKNYTVIPGHVNIEYDVQLSVVKGLEVSIDGTKAHKIKNEQNGTSTYFITSDGNHGSGSLDTKYKVLSDSPLPLFNYERDVSAVNGTVLSDVVKGGFKKSGSASVPDFVVHSDQGDINNAGSNSRETDYALFASLMAESDLSVKQILEIAEECNIPEIITVLENENSHCSHMSNERVSQYPPPKEQKFKKLGYSMKHQV
ncbi:hypothetical protein CAAN1_01S02476 [[Candida] anglica]|uniref:Peptide N-acetyl-beta-D-glucosaminyl asparaginase amidase A N-terminal domain-containing protein n=1 Tax=[Candida] anglica TaxID=148631 RepID=A0ABP0ENR7_9ASCO